MTYGSSDDRAGNSVAWWAFHNVDDVASIFFPLTDRQRRQLQTAGSLRVTTDEQASSTEITVPEILAGLARLRSSGMGIPHQLSPVTRR